MPKLLIVLPVKTGQEYVDRFQACEQTWLRGADYKGFTDAELGLVEIDQHNNKIDPIRTHRTQKMVRYAYDAGYDFVFRVDTDAYVWVNRLLASGFEQHDYMGWCLNVPQTGNWCLTTAHGGAGFTLSRKAMKIIIDAPVERYADGKYWGDLWAGQQLWKAGITCKRDLRFADHNGNIPAADLDADHQYISVHPVLPESNMLAIHERLGGLSASTVEPKQQAWRDGQCYR